MDRPGPGRALAKAMIHFEGVMRKRGCMVTIRRTPANKGVERNEIADTDSKWAAEGYTDPIGKDCLREASLAHLARKSTEARSKSTREWI